MRPNIHSLTGETSRETHAMGRRWVAVLVSFWKNKAQRTRGWKTRESRRRASIGATGENGPMLEDGRAEENGGIGGTRPS